MAFSDPQQKLKEVAPQANTKRTLPDGYESPGGFAADFGVVAKELLLKTGHGFAV